jgi:hypothetical protein
LCDVGFARVAVFTNKNRTTEAKPTARIKESNNITGIQSIRMTIQNALTIKIP